jgi:hypothetical protein
VALLRMPDTLVRELIVNYVNACARGPTGDDVLKAIVSAVCELPVTNVLVYETGRSGARCARITLPSRYASRFEAFFPDAHRLEDPMRALVTFRLAGPNRSRRA